MSTELHPRYPKNLVGSERQVVHPEWNPDSLHYDFALLKLETGLNLPEYPEIRPICWPTMPPQPDTDVSHEIWSVR